MLQQYKRLNNIVAWIAFIIACYTYFSTIEPTASFWDCGEFIATAYRLEVGHPPGAPLFMIIARFFSLFASDATQVAKMVNYMSALCSAFTILFLFWTITAIGRKIATRGGEELNMGKIYAIIGSGLVGALAYTWSDSFWFSAVEGEVYAMSSFFTALVVWAIFKWDEVADEPHANRWIVLIAYLMGLSIGVHLLNLLCIPALAFTYYFRKYEPTKKGVVYTAITSLVILAVVQYGVIPGLVKLAGGFELFFVNTVGLPFNSGTIIYILILIGLVTWGLLYTRKNNKPLWNTVLLCFTVIVIGYSSFAMILIRSNANPPIDENNPEDAVSLLSYLLREQYGESPLVYGQYYNAPLDPQNPYKDGSPVYMRDEKAGKYVITDDRKGKIPNYDPRFCTIFPRMYSDQPNHITSYKDWAGVKGTPIKVTNYKGETETLYKPTFGENLTFLFKYQMGHMYWRYFMWNFVGRQNDIQGHGGALKGNWISGIGAVDKARLGDQSKISKTYKNNKGRNQYYMFPLLLGIFGMLFHFSRQNTMAWVVLILFVFTGLAINIYLNVPPYQPRERDYAYVGSYYAFAMWIGLGVYALYDLFGKKLPQTVSALAATALSLVAVPTIMAQQNWDDHDRSNRYTARDFASDYLNSCAPNAIIFTNGDNDTFPLWYAQEVEGIRTDVRVVNLSLAQTDWYINQLRQKYYDSPPLKLTLSASQIRQGTRDYVPVYPRKEVVGYVDLKELMQFVGSDSPDAKLQTGGGQDINYFPTSKFSLKVNKEQVIKTGGIPKDTSLNVVDAIEWEVKKQYIMKNDLLILDIIASNNWERPVYFAVTIGDEFMNLDEYLQLEGLAYRLVPFKARSKDGQTGRVNTELMYANMMEKFKWGGMENPSIYMDENNQRMTMNLRNNFARLADALIEEGQKEKAIKVLDKCVEVMPKENIPYNFFMLPCAEAYYRAGAIDKADKITKEILDSYYSDLEYYFSVKNVKGLEYEKQQAMAVMQKVVMLTKGFTRDALAKDAEAKFNKMNAIYQASSASFQGMFEEQ